MGECGINRFKQKTNLKTDEFTILAGKNYREYILPEISNYKIPLEGLSIGKQLKKLKEELNK